MGSRTEGYGYFETGPEFLTAGYFWGFDGNASVDPTTGVLTLKQWKDRVSAWKAGTTSVVSPKRRYLGFPEQADLP